MAWFKCIKDNQHDGIQLFRNGQYYEFPSNPNSSFFTAISDGAADKVLKDQLFVPAHRDLQNDYHIHENLQFEQAVTINGSQYFSITAATSSFTIEFDDDTRTVEVTTGSSDVTITLPAAANCVGRVLDIAKIDSGGGNVIIDGNGSEQIKGEATLTIDFQWSNATIRSNGTRWIII